MIYRGSIPARLAQKFSNDYKAVMQHYGVEEQIELTKYQLTVINFYLDEEETNTAKIKLVNEELESLKKKYGKNFKAYRNAQLHHYFDFDTVLWDKDIYTAEEYNDLEEQALTKVEIKRFLKMCRNGLQHRLDECYLELEPEGKKLPMGEIPAGNNKKGKIKREAQDKKTSLSQEQTVLLMHYLKQERVLLNDEYLKDTEAGIAFEILTGYSQNTLRLNFGKYEQYQNKTNLKELENLLTRLKLAIEKDLRGK